MNKINKFLFLLCGLSLLPWGPSLRFARHQREASPFTVSFPSFFSPFVPFCFWFKNLILRNTLQWIYCSFFSFIFNCPCNSHLIIILLFSFILYINDNSWDIRGNSCFIFKHVMTM